MKTKKYFIFLSAILVGALFVLISCGKDTSGSSSGGEEHRHFYVSSNDDDFHWDQCFCGSIMNKTEHNYTIIDEIIKEPTCVEEGIIKFRCICGNTVEKTVSKRDHDYSILVKDEVSHWYECKCGEQSEKENHNYTAKTIVSKEPTCTEKGIKQLQCECGEYIEEEYGGGTGHVFSGWTEIKSPTIEETGLIQRICSVNSSHKEEIILPKLNAEDYILNVQKEPSCTLNGLESYSITINNQKLTYYHTLDKLEHDFEEEIRYDSQNHFNYCKSCKSAVSKDAHSYDDRKICEVCSYANHFEYYSYNGVAYVRGLVTDTSELVINEKYQGYDVERIEKIGISANCVNIYIPKTIKSISASFENYSFLTNVYFYGTIEDWFNISFSAPTSNPMCVAENFYILDSNGTFVKLENIEINHDVEKISKYSLFNFSNIISVTISGGVKKIDTSAFENCVNLQSVIITDGIDEVSANAFKGCESFTTISDVKKVGESGFEGCSNLIEINIFDTNISKNAFKNCKKLETINFKEDVVNIGESAFEGCLSLVNIEMPSTVTCISKYAFKGCEKIKKIQLGECLLEIGENSFENCISLENINIPKSIIKLSKYTFLNCKKLDNVILPDTLLTIPEGLFKGCSSLKNIEFSNKITGIGESAFHACTSLAEFELPDTLTIISKSLFEDCSSLKTLNITENIVRIEDCAFRGCSSLTSFVIPDTVKYIGEKIFNNCYRLKSVVIPFVGATLENLEEKRICHIFNAADTGSVPSNVKQIIITSKISKEAFYECSSLKKIIYTDDINNIEVPSVGLVLVIKTGVTELGDGAFKECVNLSEVHLSETITSIGRETFKDCSSLKIINIPESILEIKTNAFANCGLIEYTEYNNGYYFGNEDNNYLVFVGFINETTSLSLHSNTKIVLEKALNKYTNFSNIVIQEGITYIGSENFSSREVVNKIVLPSTIVSIGEDAFDIAIEYLYYDGTIEDWCNITFSNYLSNPTGYEGFYILNSNGNISYNGKKYSQFTDIEIPNTITKIGDYQFASYSALENITIPSSVVNIGLGAFSGCQSLKTVKIEGEGLLNIDEYAFEYCYELREINIPNSVETIGYNIFHCCESFSYLSLPFIGERADGNGATNFGFIFGYENGSDHNSYMPGIGVLEITGDINVVHKQAFVRCSINQLIFSGKVREFESVVFVDAHISSLSIPNTVTFLDISNFYDSNYVWGSLANPAYISINDFYYNGDITDLVRLSDKTAFRFNPFRNVYILDENGTVEYRNEKYSKLTDIIIPDDMTRIDDRQFYNWYNVKRVYIPKSVKAIYSDAFYGIESLSAVYYGGTLADWCEIYIAENANPLIYANFLYLLDENGSVEYNGQKYSELKDIIIPEEVTKIGNYQFEGLYYVNNVIIHDSVTFIGKGAFKNTNINKLRIPFIGASNTSEYNYFGYIFDCDNDKKSSGYVSVRTVELSDRIIEIPDFAFYGCNSINTMIMPKSVTKIGSSAFDCNIRILYYGGTLEDWCNVTLESAKSSPIGAEKFYVINPNSNSEEDKYISLENIVLDGSIPKINNYTFANHQSLESLVILEGVTEIGEYVFYNCKSLTSIELPNSLKNIYEYTFKGCSNLKYVEVKPGTEYIEAGAFQGCTSLIELTLPFIGSSRDTANGPQNVLGYIFGYKLSTAYSWSDVYSTDYSQPNNASESIDNYLLQYSCHTRECTDSSGNTYYELYLYYYEIPKTLKKVTITDEDKISDAAFRGCYFIEEIDYECETISIGRYAFYKCSGLTSYTVSSKATSIGFNAFGKCDNLEKIELPFAGEKRHGSENSNFGYIFGSYQVEKQHEYIPSKLEEVTITDCKIIFSEAFINCKNLKIINLPIGLEKIENYAFANCSGLETITFPKSVKYIGLGALKGCSFERLELPFIGESLDGTDNTHFGYIFGAETYLDNSTYVPRCLKNIIVTNCTNIKEYDMYGCTNLESITIKKGIVSVDKNAFKNFTNLIIFDAYEGVGKIEEYAFAGCTNLEYIRISSAAEMIENYAFTKCSKLIINCNFDEHYASKFDSSWSLGCKKVEYNATENVLGIDLNAYCESILVGSTYQLIASAIPSNKYSMDYF